MYDNFILIHNFYAFILCLSYCIPFGSDWKGCPFCELTALLLLLRKEFYFIIPNEENYKTLIKEELQTQTRGEEAQRYWLPALLAQIEGQ